MQRVFSVSWYIFVLQLYMLLKAYESWEKQRIQKYHKIIQNDMVMIIQ